MNTIGRYTHTIHMILGSHPSASVHEGPVSLVGPAVMAQVESFGHKVELIERWTSDTVVELAYEVTSWNDQGRVRKTLHRFVQPSDPWKKAGPLS